MSLSTAALFTTYTTTSSSNTVHFICVLTTAVVNKTAPATLARLYSSLSVCKTTSTTSIEIFLRKSWYP